MEIVERIVCLSERAALIALVAISQGMEFEKAIEKAETFMNTEKY